MGELDGSSSARVDDIVTALSDSGLRANSSTDIQSVEWSKFVGWSGVSALAVLTRLPTSEFMSRPETALLAGRVMRELQRSHVLMESRCSRQATARPLSSMLTKTTHWHRYWKEVNDR